MKSSILLKILLAAITYLPRLALAEEEKVVTEVPVHVGKIARATLHAHVVAYGTVDAQPATKGKRAARARVASPFTGVLSEVNCYEGLKVKKGDPLFLLDSRAVKVTLKKAQQSLAFAEQNVERQKKLLQVEGTSLKSYQQAEQDLNAARSELAAAETQAKLLRITAPVSGTVTMVNFSTGEVVDVSSVLAEIVDLSRLVISANIPASEAMQVKADALAIVSSGSRKVDGKVTFVSPRVDVKTGTVLVRITLPRGAGLNLGQFVSVQVVVEEHKNALVVPISSLIKNGDGKPAVALVEGDKAVQKPVAVGLREDGFVEVQGEGLKEGADVVTVGAYGLPAESKIRVITE